MAKKTGFYVNVKYFVEVDKKDFAKQAAAYGLLAEIEKSKTLPDDFASSAVVVDIAAKQGSYDPGASETDEQIDTLGGAIDGAPGKRGRKPAETSGE